MRRTGRHAGGRAPRRKFPPDIQRIIRRRRWWAWAAIAALALMLFCGGAGPEYPFPANAAHAVLVVLILALWAAALCLVRVGTVRLRNRGVYTVGVIDALFRPVRHWATPRTWRREQSSKFVACFGLLIFFASSLRDQLNEVAYLADPAGQTLATRNLQGPILLAGMVLDALAVGIASGLILGAWRRRSRQRPWFIPAAWVGRRP